MKKRIISSIVIFIVLINVISVIYPITGFNSRKAYDICKSFNLISSGKTDRYVTRDEFLESFLKCVGLTDEIRIGQSHVSGSTDPTDDFSQAQFQNTHDYDYYVTLYSLGIRVHGMQTYYTPSDIEGVGIDLFKGNEHVTMRDALVMMAGCINDTNTEVKTIHNNSREYWTLYATTHMNGLLLPIESAYWAILDTKLKRKDMYILFSRFLEQDRYRYLVSRKYPENLQIDEERSMTYREFLESISSQSEQDGKS